jgi:RNA polymerase sigma-70 factor (family 1)
MKDFGLFNDEELMQEIKADNMVAFDLLYKKYSNRVYKFGYSILKTQEESENLVQDVFLSLWEHRHNIEKNSSVKSYLFTIAYNSVISVIRKKSKEARFIEYLKSIQEKVEMPDNDKIEYIDLISKLNGIVVELPKRQKEVFLLHKVKGLKYIEIAERLNISVNTIENHMSRALKTIREKIASYTLISILLCHMFV